MVASIKPHRDEPGLPGGLMMIDGTRSAAQDGRTRDHSHRATAGQVRLKTIWLRFTAQMM
ncbi:MAG TPA: hypothetical protein VEH31_03690 [Streptosporangiaceae bacterium]|nr:hypothetical protein [Streptosporangiaceae bacterium]